MEEVNTGVPGVVATPPAPKKKHSRSGRWAGATKGSPEYREKDKEYRRQVRETERAERDRAAGDVLSTQELKKSEAKETLAERIRNPRVLDKVVDLAHTAASVLNIPFNDYLVRNGLRQTLRVRQCDTTPCIPLAMDETVVSGEVIVRGDLFNLWDYGYFRQPESFDEWLQERGRCKRDAFYLGKEILDKDFHESPHGGWRDFLPQFDPTGLRPNFTQEDAKAWLARQSDKKTFVLQSSRNAYKSTFAAIWAITAILCQPCIRIRLVTETADLAEDFVSALRTYFVLEIPDSPTKFNQLFPEFSVAFDEGKQTTYDCPLRHLNLVAKTVEASSMQSGQAGRRCDILLCDDIQSNESVGDDKQLEKGINRFDLLQKLVEVSGCTVSLSTPWHKKDVSGILIERADNDPETLTAIRVDSAWEVLPHAKNKAILDLQESDVKLLFPERLTFKFLLSEARKNEKLFLSQNLCRFPDDADGKLVINFDLDTLNRAVRPYNFFQDPMQYQLLGTYGGIDTAWSLSKFADYSAMICGKIYANARTGKHILAVTDVRLAQLRIPELAHEIIRFIEANRPTNVVIERSGAWASLAQAISKEAMTREMPLPSIYWRPTNLGTQNQKAKMSRIKALETPLAAGELVFLQHPMLDELFDQLVRCDGSRSTPTKKDDLPDALSLLHAQYFAPLGGTKITTKEDLERQEQEYQAIVRQGSYQRVFGNSIIPFTPRSTEPESDHPTGGIHGTLSRFGLTRAAA